MENEGRAFYSSHSRSLVALPPDSLHMFICTFSRWCFHSILLSCTVKFSSLLRFSRGKSLNFSNLGHKYLFHFRRIPSQSWNSERARTRGNSQGKWTITSQCIIWSSNNFHQNDRWWVSSFLYTWRQYADIILWTSCVLEPWERSNVSKFPFWQEGASLITSTNVVFFLPQQKMVSYGDGCRLIWV